MYTEDQIKDFVKAGKIASESLEYAKSITIKGASLLEVSDKTEQKIRQLGGEPAFPTQLSFDMTAAHNCADPDDSTVLESQLVKIDVGVHINGAVADNACSVDLSGQWSDLIKASKAGCEAAAKVLGPGIELRAIGKEIDQTVASFGFKSIRNLCGHGVNIYNIHTDPTIPNYDSGDKRKLEEGMTIAVEPFATPGAGVVAETGRANIFMFAQKRPVRSPYARELLTEIEKLKGLPFTTRWFTEKLGLSKVTLGLRELQSNGVIRAYPPLNEVSKAVVSQHENTFLITANGADVTTKR